MVTKLTGQAASVSKLAQSLGASKAKAEGAVSSVLKSGSGSSGSSTKLSTIGKESADTTGYGLTPTFRTKAETDQYNKTLAMFSQPNVSTTTISNGNKIDNTIPTNNTKLEVLADKGLRQNQGGETVYADGSVYQPKTEDKKKSYVYKATDGNYYDSQSGDLATDNYERQQEDLFGDMKASLDSSTKAQIDSIQQMYDVRKKQLEDINKRQEAGVTSGLLMAGTGGQGGAFRYTPVSAMGVVSEQERYGVMQLAQLDAEENNLIAEARAAQQQGEYQIMEKKLSLVEQKRQEKLQAAKELNDQIAEQNKQITQSTRDSAIASLLTQGITDPTAMLDYLNFDEQGNQIGDFTIDEVTGAMDKISKVTNTPIDKLTGDAKNFFVLKDIPGALPAGVKDLGSYVRWTKNLSEGNNISPDGKVYKVEKLEDIKALPVSDLTKSVMAGYGKIKDLTPTDKSKVLTEMYQVGFNPQTYVINKLSNLVTAWASMPEEYKGFVEGLKWWASNTDPKVAAFNSASSVLTREIARLNDVGMLSDQDVASYTDAMPSRRDADLSIVLNKISGLASTIAQKKVENVGMKIKITEGKNTGKTAIVSFDGETLLDPETGKELE